MSLDNVYLAYSFPKEEPFSLRMVNEGAVWLFYVAHTLARPVRRGVALCLPPTPARPVRRGVALCPPVDAEPRACPGSFF